MVDFVDGTSQGVAHRGRHAEKFIYTYIVGDEIDDEKEDGGRQHMFKHTYI